ncbi:UBC27 [Symbiodinium necroappetens]|uniref:UBC27 protein n=1 Tax=Symbiodinium necroappetens TaxID=1628268 RepID=A0A812LZU8_9DINO|nr:UBC27 [Symbiodinium necroappetens]
MRALSSQTGPLGTGSIACHKVAALAAARKGGISPRIAHDLPTGAICLDVLGKEWSPALTIRTALLSIQALLSSPEPDDPQDAEVAEMYKHNRELFVQTAKYWTETFACEQKSSNDEKVQKIVDMGFTQEQAKSALEKHGYDETTDFPRSGKFHAALEMRHDAAEWLSNTVCSGPGLCCKGLVVTNMVVTLAERKAAQRAETLQGLAVGLLADLKAACGTAHELGRRQLTWGTVVPGVLAGSDEDMDDVLAMLASLMAEDRKSLGFQKIEWCKAQAPTQWVEQPSRFGSHMHIRVHWSDEDGAYFH